MVEKFNYLTFIRPNITYLVCVASQSMSDLQISYCWDTIIKFLLYLKSAPVRGLIYFVSRLCRIASFSSSNWAGSSFNRLFITGMYLLAGTFVSWMSKK